VRRFSGSFSITRTIISQDRTEHRTPVGAIQPFTVAALVKRT
jgi:hypothetical protein